MCGMSVGDLQKFHQSCTSKKSGMSLFSSGGKHKSRGDEIGGKGWKFPGCEFPVGSKHRGVTKGRNQEQQEREEMGITRLKSPLAALSMIQE